MWMILIQSFEGLNRTKRLISLMIKWEFLLHDCLSWDVGLFLLLDWNWNICSSWALSLTTFGLEFIPLTILVLSPLDSDWNYTIGSPGSLACWLQILGLLSLRNHWANFLSSLSIYISFWFWFSGGTLNTYGDKSIFLFWSLSKFMLVAILIVSHPCIPVVLFFNVKLTSFCWDVFALIFVRMVCGFLFHAFVCRFW